MNNVKPRVMNTEQAALYIGMSKDYLKKARVIGGGPEFIKTGRKVQYLIESLDAFLDAKTKYSQTAMVKGNASSH